MSKDAQVFASSHRGSMWTSNTVLGSKGIELTTIFEFLKSSASLEMLHKLIGRISSFNLSINLQNQQVFKSYLL